MSRYRRGRKFEVYHHEDKRQFVVKYDSADRKFFVVVAKGDHVYDETYIEGDTPGGVVADLKVWLKEHDDLVWEPILTVGGVDLWNDESGLDFDRFFRAKRQADGDWLYRKWDINFEKVKKDKVEWGDVSHLPEYGTPGNISNQAVDNDDKIAKYTPARWRTLQKLDEMLVDMKNRISAFFDQDVDVVIKKIDSLGKRRGNLLTMLPEVKVKGKK